MEAGDWQKFLLWVSFIFFLGSLLLRQEAAINQDLGRHLRLGEMIMVGGPPGGEASEQRTCALYKNCLTYTFPDYPFVNHHWGSEVIFYFIYKLGGFGGLILFKALILGAALGITVIHAANRYPLTANGKSRLTVNDSRLTKNVIATAITFFSVQMMADRLTTRPEIFGYLLFSLLFWLLNKSYIDKQRSLLIYITPVVMLVWVNLHISFIFGLILVWIWTGSQILNTEFRILNEMHKKSIFGGKIQNSVFRIQYLHFLAIPAISTVATIFNPAGWRGAVMPLAIMKDYGYTIVENMTPFFLRAFKPQPEYWIYAGLTAMTFILALLTGKLGKFAGLAVLVFSIFPLIAVRHLAFFALVVPTVLTGLTLGLQKGLSLPDGKDSPLHNDKLPILVSGGLLIAALTNPIPLAYARLPAIGLAADGRHEEAVKFVKNHDLQGKMWNNYDIGSYLEWALPEYKTFVDGRPEAFPAGFFRQTYIPMQESREKWDEVTKNYDIQWAFAALTDATPWFQKWRLMIQSHEGWKLVYIDKTTAVYVKL